MNQAGPRPFMRASPVTAQPGHHVPRLSQMETSFSQEPNWKGTEPLIHTRVSMTKGKLTGQVFNWGSSFLGSKPSSTVSQDDQSYVE